MRQVPITSYPGAGAPPRATSPLRDPFVNQRVLSNPSPPGCSGWLLGASVGLERRHHKGSPYSQRNPPYCPQKGTPYSYSQLVSRAGDGPELAAHGRPCLLERRLGWSGESCGFCTCGA
jgi:hypothetical protein